MRPKRSRSGPAKRPPSNIVTKIVKVKEITVLERERQRLLSESHVCFIEVEEDEYWLMVLTRRMKSTISAMFRLKDADHFYKPGSEPGATYHMVSMMAGGHGGGVPSPRLSIDFPGMSSSLWKS